LIVASCKKDGGILHSVQNDQGEIATTPSASRNDKINMLAMTGRASCKKDEGILHSVQNDQVKAFRMTGRGVQNDQVKAFRMTKGRRSRMTGEGAQG